MSKKNQCVIKHGDKWALKDEGNSKVTKITKTQKEAIAKDSYGNDPCPPKDQEH
jgi:hypothetical protein